MIDELGIPHRTVDISAAVDGLAGAIERRACRLGNVMARSRMITLFDLSAASRAPLGTGNKTERLFGYFTWHADDSPPVNPSVICSRRRCGLWRATSVYPSDRVEAGRRGPDQGPDRRRRLRHLLPSRLIHSPLDSAGISRPGDRRPRASVTPRSGWCAGGWTRPTGSGGCPRSPCSAEPRSVSII